MCHFGFLILVLIVFSASTLENWIREFNRFSPGMQIVSYYGTINERAALRREFLETMDSWDVIITTYNFAQGGGNDSKFFKKIAWSVSRYFVVSLTRRF
jgi:SWI/SNF-related matrix-associated actin-dependent regulator 1 of chromatin subfamily A